MNGDLVVNRYNLYLKSSQRTQGTNEYPIYMLSRPLYLTNPFNIFELTVKQACIPYSFFSVNDTYGNTSGGSQGTLKFNQLQWVMCKGGSYPSTTTIAGGGTFANPLLLEIPSGNYSAQSMLTAVVKQFVNDINISSIGGLSVNTTMFNFT